MKSILRITSLLDNLTLSLTDSYLLYLKAMITFSSQLSERQALKYTSKIQANVDNRINLMANVINNTLRLIYGLLIRSINMYDQELHLYCIVYINNSTDRFEIETMIKIIKDFEHANKMLHFWDQQYIMTDNGTFSIDQSPVLPTKNCS